ncbi:hypothetical protein M441DRAFT_60318 [Trichoderma asperellum CBS 433.97]|uniref:Uncharacterized protein n=1 Tax=Trichoderma asperellum (strain ATCC 204424 / CBS 433.97 / NBRC 101777) TaxID=1042311 RepID=A0A2T3YZK8_TRIA4|nr:hypothetical protein M441DRAFT_60318 [Trichoderma asperellum CBS 433.97]PTB38011.1 hypothetical protein M441DRAFT_60318 [Trichoderma asperellum CBS 433.97]
MSQRKQPDLARDSEIFKHPIPSHFIFLYLIIRLLISCPALLVVRCAGAKNLALNHLVMRPSDMIQSVRIMLNFLRVGM